MADEMKRALVTGGSMGLGRAFAAQLLAEGWHVTSVDRRPAGQAEGGTAANHVHLTCDLSDRAAVLELARQCETLPPFDCVILNAGANATGRFERIDRQAIERLVTLNTLTPVQIAAHLAGRGLMKNPAHLVFIASLSRFTGYPGAAAYAATKEAIAVYAKSIRKPFARLGITVSCAFPGPLRTDHAERHAPPDAKPDKRMPADEAAARILASAFSGRHTIIPGMGAKASALAASVAPGISARILRRLIYDRLDREVW